MSEYVKPVGEVNRAADGASAADSPAKSVSSQVQQEGGDSLAGVQINMGDSERSAAPQQQHMEPQTEKKLTALEENLP